MKKVTPVFWYAVIISGLPFSIIMILMGLSFMKAVRKEVGSGKRKR